MEIERILEDHALYISTNGKKGKRAILIAADLIAADLRGADLRGADLTRANLTRAILMGTNLAWTDLTGADLTGAYRPEGLEGYQIDKSRDVLKRR